MQKHADESSLMTPQMLSAKDSSLKQHAPLYRYMWHGGTVGDVTRKVVVYFASAELITFILLVVIALTNKDMMEDRIGTSMYGFLVGMCVAASLSVNYILMRRLRYDMWYATALTVPATVVTTDEEKFYAAIVKWKRQLLSTKDEQSKSLGPCDRYMWEGQVGDVTVLRIVSSLTIWVSSFLLGFVVIWTRAECTQDRFRAGLCGFVAAIWLMSGMLVFATYWRRTTYDECFAPSSPTTDAKTLKVE